MGLTKAHPIPKHHKVKLSGSVHKHGAGGGREVKDIDPKKGTHNPPRMSDMTPAAMKSNECGKTKSRLNSRYGYKETVFGNEAGK